VIRNVSMQVVVTVLVQQDQAARPRRPQKRHDDQRSGQPDQDSPAPESPILALRRGSVDAPIRRFPESLAVRGRLHVHQDF
jgi:hypothetical protein